MLCDFELVRVLSGLQELVLLGHHQSLAVVVVHSLVSGTIIDIVDIVRVLFSCSLPGDAVLSKVISCKISLMPRDFLV